MKKKVLVIVAHPDDETIWMGGMLLKNKNDWDTTIISLCRRDDPDRAPKFRKVCQLFKAKSWMSDLEDEKLMDLPLFEVVNRIKKFSDNKNYDYLFTHGKNGEYGHKRHLDVNQAVIQMVKDNSLSAKKIFFFSYAKKGKICYAHKNAGKSANKFIKLDKTLLELKKQIIQRGYGFNKGSFEDLCCQNAESFKIEEVKNKN